MCPESGRDRRGPFVENFPLKEREVVPPNQKKGGFCSASAAAPGIGAGTRAGGIGAGFGLPKLDFLFVPYVVRLYFFPFLPFPLFVLWGLRLRVKANSPNL